MKKNTIILGSGLILLSVLLHGVHFVIFRDLHHMMIYLLGDIAFIPLEVFFVSMVLDKLIEKREHEKTVNKINMIVGLFYQEAGNNLLNEFVIADKIIDLGDINANYKWTEDDYYNLQVKITNHDHTIDINKLNLVEVDKILTRFQPNILNLITNQALQEHEKFTDLLMSISHLSEELKQRNIYNISDFDKQHLTVDIERVYNKLSYLWVDYIKHLQKEYPYLFLTAITNNPYDVREREVIEKDLILTKV